MRRLFLASFLCVCLSSCGGDDNGGAPSPATQPTGPIVVSGLVLATNGQLAFHRPSGFMDWFGVLFGPLAFASIAGQSPVPDGTSVTFGRRISLRDRTVAVLATTSTKEGRYSFNLPNLGTGFGSDLLIFAESARESVDSFVTTPTVDIDESSDVALRLTEEKITGTAEGSISQLTLKEANEITAAVKLFTIANQFPAGTSVRDTRFRIRDAILQDAEITAFITDAAAPGQTLLGPGDVGHYFPFLQGNTWTTQGTRTETGKPPVSFNNTTTVPGARIISGVTATVISESNPEGAALPTEEYFTEDTTGITYQGNNDPSDAVTSQVVPFQVGKFPLQAGGSFEQFNKSGLNFGQDLDGDGRNETVNTTQRITVVDFSTVTVPASTFQNTAQIRTDSSSTVILSSNRQAVTVTGTSTTWYAPGVGPIKKLSTTQVSGNTITASEELVSFTVNAQ